MKRKALSVFLTLAFLLALVACIRKPQQVVVQLHWGAYGDAGSSGVRYGAPFLGSDGGHLTYGMIPSGQAGGCLTGAYPNPGLDAACVPEGGGGAISSLTQDTVGSGSGAVATTTLQAQAGAITFSDAGVISCAAGDTTCSLTQASESTATKGADMTFTPQISTHATDNGGGNVGIALQAPAGAGAEAFFKVGRGGTQLAWIGNDPGYSIAGIWLGSSTPTNSNITLINNSGYAGLNGTTAVELFAGRTLELYADTSGVVAETNLFLGADPGLTGGGAGVFGMRGATTYPTLAPVAGSVLLSGISGDYGTLHHFPASLSGGSMANYVIGPGWSGTANTQISSAMQHYGEWSNTTTSGTFAAMPAFTTVTGHAYVSTCTCLARCTGGAGCTAGAIAATTSQAAFIDGGGSITLATQTDPGSSAPIFFANTSSMAALMTYQTGSHQFIWSVVGIASATIDWTCDATYLEN